MTSRPLPAAGDVEADDLSADSGATPSGPFAEAVAAEIPRLLRVAQRLLPRGDGAEDLVQEALVRALDARRRGRGPHGPAGPWLMTILVNLFRDRLRRREPAAGSPAAEVIDPSPGADPAIGCGAGELEERVRAAIARLPARQREVVALCIDEEMPATQAAESLGVSSAAVRMALSHARQRLREILAAELE